MMDPETKPDSRAMRFAGFTIMGTTGVLWGARGLIPQPWQVIRFLCKDLWGIAMEARYPNYQFAFNGRWVTPGWRYFPASLQYISHDWKASLTVAGALLIGGIVGVLMDKIVKKGYAQTTRSIK